MLEPAVAFVDDSQLEQIRIDRCAAEQIDLRLANARQIVREALVVAAVPAGNRDGVGDGAGFEA